jgi:PAS domain S-box-containing protein
VTPTPSRRSHSVAAFHRDEVILALEARERFLDAVFGSLEPFVTVDADWRVTFVNRAAAEMAEGGTEGLIGGDLRTLMPAWFHDETEAHTSRSMVERVSVEYEVAGPDGRVHLGTAHPLADGGLAIHVRDITEARRRELEREELCSALAESEQRIEAVFEASPFAMSLTEMPSGRLVRVNRAFEDLFGYRREDLIGRTSLELGISDPNSQDEVAQRFATDGSVHEYEVERTTRDGLTRILAISLDWVTVGQHTAVLTSIRDVTERAEAEAALRASETALRASEARYRSIVEATGDGIMIGDLHGTIVFANQRMADMLGYGVDELLGKHGFDLIFPDWRPAVLENRAALDGGVAVRGEFKLRHKDGRPVWTIFSSTPMTDAVGAHVGNLTMHSDITELRMAQAALRERELAAAAQEERSRVARDLHDSVTQALFAASLKAEALTGVADASPETAEVAEEVRRLAAGALAQMRTLLLELRGEPLEKVPLRQLLRTVVDATESRTRTRVELSVEGAETLPADVHVVLYHIAQEALNNVARHARAEHAWVDLLVEPVHVRLRVRDDGRGFDPGPQGPAHLGLRSMRERAVEVGADLRLETAPGAGTDVVVEWRARPS